MQCLYSRYRASAVAAADTVQDRKERADQQHTHPPIRAQRRLRYVHVSAVPPYVVQIFVSVYVAVACMRG